MKTKKNTIRILVIVLSLSLITALTSITYLSYATTVFAVHHEGQQKFSAQLSGDQQVPPIQTSASGTAWFKPMQDNVWLDRKSTRLNSSHGYISYAVFCLKKKKKKKKKI